MRAILRSLGREAGLRFLLRRKAACAVAVLTMALALGANTAVFSIVKTFLFSSIGVPDPDRVFVVAPVRNLPGRGSVVFSEAYPNYLLLRATQQAFTAVTCISQGVASWDDDGESRPLQSARVTASFFATMRVYPVIGRTFAVAEEGPQPARVVVISHALWRSALAGDASALGKTMLLNGEPHTIIGVMPAGFSQPVPTDVWLPFDMPLQQRTAITGARNLLVYARLADGRPRAAANTEAASLTKRALAASADNKDFWYEMRSLRGVLLNGADSTVLLVQSGAAVLLLLAVLNLASLLLAWGFERRQELAVRQALGAGEARVLRMLFLQSLCVVGAGAILGLAATGLAVPSLRGLELGQTLAFFTSQIRVDPYVLGATAAVAMLCGLAAGVLPAVFSRNTDLAVSLRAGATRSTTLSPAALRWQRTMVVLQAALSLVILAAAALIGVSFAKLSRVPSGFVAGDLLVARINLQRAGYEQAPTRVRFGGELLENLSREPAIAAAAYTSTLPVSDVLWGARFFIELPDGSTGSEPLLLHIRRTSPSYLATMGIPLLAGRGFATADDSAGPKVAIVSQSLAARAWPNENAIGKRLYRFAGADKPPAALEVIGVAGNVMDAGNNAPPGETVYVPWSQLSTTQMSIVVRPRGAADAIAALRHALRVTDPLVAAHDVAHLDALAAQVNALPRLQTLLLLIFAAASLAIAALGSYGVMSQLVATREREYALRLVFGAAPADLGRSVLLQLARLTVPGIGGGVLVVVLLGGTLERFVFGVAPRSVGVLATVSAIMLAIALVATLPSVLRAMRVDVRLTLGGG